VAWELVGIYLQMTICPQGLKDRVSRSFIGEIIGKGGFKTVQQWILCIFMKGGIVI
jgi:hypothetical protein